MSAGAPYGVGRGVESSAERAMGAHPNADDAPTTWRRRAPVAYVTWLSAALLAQGIGGALSKVATDRADDLLHNVLHAITGVIGLVCRNRPRGFAVAFGGFYLTLAAAGAAEWVTVPGLPLATGDHVFHAVVGAVTLAVAAVGVER